MTLCHDQAIRCAKAKVHVYSESVLCLGKMHSQFRSEMECGETRSLCSNNPTGTTELSGIDVEPIEFVWNSHRLRFSDTFGKISTLDKEIQSRLRDEAVNNSIHVDVQ